MRLWRREPALGGQAAGAVTGEPTCSDEAGLTATVPDYAGATADCRGGQPQSAELSPSPDYSVLVRGRPVSCDAVYVTRVVHVPYVVEHDEEGAWCASAPLRPGVAAFGDGATPEEAITDLRASLETLVEVVGLRQA